VKVRPDGTQIRLWGGGVRWGSAWVDFSQGVGVGRHLKMGLVRIPRSKALWSLPP